jgi:uncharacterized protein YacL
MFLALRVIIILLFVFSGYIIGMKYNSGDYGLLIGGLLGFTAVTAEILFRRIELGVMIGGFIGIGCGLLFAYLLVLPLKIFLGDEVRTISFGLMAVFGYGGLLLGLNRGKSISVASILKLFRGQDTEENLKILDTSVIIDGRIADICETGFLEGVFILPQFILQELQHIADAGDSMKRARGRRGLDILHKIQKMSRITVRIIDQDFPKIKEVDAKLVALAKVLNAKVITNDFNLNKVAELQGVSVLNINELANSLKPVVLPGETMKVFVMKEGKEYNQGVAYLDDGTMVVVENARRLIGKNTEVTVTSVLQTTAGRMIFSKLKDEYERDEMRVGK